jgi:hypothetical protein
MIRDLTGQRFGRLEVLGPDTSIGLVAPGLVALPLRLRQRTHHPGRGAHRWPGHRLRPARARAARPA